jgi:hypothetical protein
VWTAALETLLAGDGLGARARARAIVGVGVEACLAWPDREGFPSASALRQCLREAAEVLG